MHVVSPWKKLLNWLAFGVIAVSWVIALIFGWLALMPLDPGAYINSVTMPDRVVAGSTVFATIDYCKTSPGKATSSYTLVTSQNQAFYFPPVSSSRPVGCDVVSVEVSIPASAPPGTAAFEVDVLLEYNSLHKDIINVTSNRFVIDKSEGHS